MDRGACHFLPEEDEAMGKLRPGPLVTASLLCLACAAPAFAAPPWGSPNPPPSVPPGRGAPGPLAGAGLPFPRCWRISMTRVRPSSFGKAQTSA